jgi:hypothetical protein
MKWEYKTWSSPVSIGEAMLKHFGKQGWELVGMITELVSVATWLNMQLEKNDLTL